MRQGQESETKGREKLVGMKETDFLPAEGVIDLSIKIFFTKCQQDKIAFVNQTWAPNSQPFLERQSSAPWFVCSSSPLICCWLLRPDECWGTGLVCQISHVFLSPPGGIFQYSKSTPSPHLLVQLFG